MTSSRKSPDEPVGLPSGEHVPAGAQLSLFGAAASPPATVRAPGRRHANPHLHAAKQLARRMRRLPSHSPEEVQAGLAICRQLRAYLADDPTPLH